MKLRQAFVRTATLLLTIAALQSVAMAQRDAATAHSAITPVPREGGWINRHNSFNERAKQGNVDLVFIGDSITQGWEGAGKEVWKKHYDKRNAMNLGIGGDRTQHVLWRLENGNIDGIKPKLAVVMIGTNNSNGNDNSAEEIADGIKAIVAKLRKDLPETKVLLLGVFPRGAMTDEQITKQLNRRKSAKSDEDELAKQIESARENVKKQRAKISAVNDSVKKLADDEKIFYLDIGEEFTDDDGTLPDDIMPDYLHLSPKGYAIWAEAIEPKVSELLGE